MTPRTLADELNSVLIAHSLQAPEPQASIDEVLARVAGTVPKPARRRWPGTAQNWAVAATVLGVVVLGGLAVKAGGGGSSNKSASIAAVPLAAPTAAQAAAAGANAAAGSDKAAAPVNAPPGAAPSGAAAAGAASSGAASSGAASSGAASSGAAECVPSPSPPVVLRIASANFNIIYCTTAAGSRVELQTHENAQARVVATLIQPSAGLQVFAISVLGNRILVQALAQSELQVPPLAAPGASVNSSPSTPAGSVLELTFAASAPATGEPRFALQSSVVVAKPCTTGDVRLAVTAEPNPPVTTIADGSAAGISILNRSAQSCAVSGYPTVEAINGVHVVVASNTLAGPYGGIRHATSPPIIVLSPGDRVSAVVESGVADSSHNPDCGVSSVLRVGLPNGGATVRFSYSLGLCGVQVHPFARSAG